MGALRGTNACRDAVRLARRWRGLLEDATVADAASPLGIPARGDDLFFRRTALSAACRGVVDHVPCADRCRGAVEAAVTGLVILLIPSLFGIAIAS